MRGIASRAWFRVGAAALVLLALALVGSACGSSSKSAVCSSRDDLRSSVDSLLKVNPAKDGLDEVSSRLGDVRDKTTALAKAAGDQYKPQVDALQTSSGTLSTTLKQLGSSPSASGLAELPGEIAAVSTDTKALLDAVGKACS